MGPSLLLFVALHLFCTLTWSKVVDDPQYAVNSLSDKLNDYFLFIPPDFYDENGDFLDDENVVTDNSHSIAADEDKAELKFLQPPKFYKNNAKAVAKNDAVGKSKQKYLQDNFIRFGKRSYEEFPLANNLGEEFLDKNPRMRLERSQETARDARGDNFMRFGRSVNTKNDFMRFGRGANDFMRFGRAGDNFMRFGRSANQDFMRFGRNPSQDFLRFGRTPHQDFIRFGRTPSQDFMRFGRTPSQENLQEFTRLVRTPNQDFMRFGRANQDGFMRFGRNPHHDFMRFGRSSPKIPVNTNFMRYSRPDNFMRFGRAPPQPTDNFIRFGKSLEKSNDKNVSQPMMGKNELKQTIKLIHETDKNVDSENPVDKAIKVLFDKQQHNANEKSQSEEGANGDFETESEINYF